MSQTGHYDGTIKVSGRNLVNGSGQILKIAGVNSQINIGYSYDKCVRNDGDTATLSQHDANIHATGANIVRFFLDEDCWLNINGVANGGASYQATVAAYVADIHAHNMYALIDLSSAQPGTVTTTPVCPPVCSQYGPDATHSITFWTQVATAYASDPGVIFELFNEPNPATQDTAAWTCLFHPGHQLRAG